MVVKSIDRILPIDLLDVSSNLLVLEKVILQVLLNQGQHIRKLGEDEDLLLLLLKKLLQHLVQQNHFPRPLYQYFVVLLALLGQFYHHLLVHFL